MAGAYAHGSGHDLGLPLEFRSRIGLSRRIADRWRLGLAFEHKSNAGAGDHNPGVETLFVTVTRIYLTARGPTERHAPAAIFSRRAPLPRSFPRLPQRPAVIRQGIPQTR